MVAGKVEQAKKFIVLSLFCALSTINGFYWLMFAPAKQQLEDSFSPHFSDTQLTLLSSWQPIMYMVAAPLVTAALVRPDGLRLVMKMGCVLELIGATIKFIACIAPHNAYSMALLHVGQIFSACVSPVAIGTPAELSAVWFPEDQRARATGAAVLANNFGNAIAYLLVPAIASKFAYSHVVLMEFCMAVALISLSWLFLPPQPKCHRITAKPKVAIDDEPEEETKVNIIQETKALLKIPSALLLCIVYMWSSGGYVAWTSLFDDLLSELWSDEFIGNLTFVSTIAYIVGGLATSALVDSKLRHRMRAILITSCAVSTAGCLLLAISVPSVFAKGETIILDGGDGWLFFVFALCGFCNGAAAPVFYELVAEISYPICEGVSGNVLSYFENAGSLILYQGVGNFASGRAMNLIFAAGMGATVVLLTFVRNSLHRMEYEREQRLGLADIDTFDAAGVDQIDNRGAAGIDMPYERMEELM
jgi:MFS family permease